LQGAGERVEAQTTVRGDVAEPNLDVSELVHTPARGPRNELGGLHARTVL
jgi:hypothetical protein